MEFKNFLKLFDPVNLGSSERVSINQMIETLENISGFHVKKNIY